MQVALPRPSIHCASSCTPAGGCSNGTELAEIVCTALCSPAGAAFLSGLAEGRQALLCTAICKHGRAAVEVLLVLACLHQPAGCLLLLLLLSSACTADVPCLPPSLLSCHAASGEHSARLLAALHGLPECQPRARMALALALVRAAGQQCAGEPPRWSKEHADMHAVAAPDSQPQLLTVAPPAASCSAGLLASVPGFHAALAALEQELQEQLQHGPPTAPNPHGRPLPPAIVERFQCDRSPPGQHCNLCQPVVVSGRWWRQRGATHRNGAWPGVCACVAAG